MYQSIEEVKKHFMRYIILADKVYFLKHRMMSAKTVGYGNEVHGGSNKTIIDKIMDIDVLKEEMASIEAEINAMDNELHKTIMQYKYIMSMTFSQIADATGYSTRQIIRIHVDALESFVCKDVTKCH